MEKLFKDILQEVPLSKLPDLRDTFNNDYGKHIYYFIDNYIEWLRKDPGTKIKFLCPNGDWSDGTVIGVSDEGMYHIILFTFDKKCEKLRQALMESNLIDWARGPLLSFIHGDHAATVEEVLDVKNLTVAAETYSTIYKMDAESAAKLEISCPEDVYIAPLKREHAYLVNKEWIYTFDGSLAYIEKIIEMNGGVGLFGKDDNALRAWTLLYDSGGPGVLHTLNEYRHRGYGTIVTKVLTKQLGESGKDSVVFISQMNNASQNMFKRIGYKFIDKCRWYYILDTINYSNVNLNWK